MQKIVCNWWLVSWPWLYLPPFALSRPVYVIPESSEPPSSIPGQTWTHQLHPKSACILAMHSQTLWPPCISSTHSQPNTPSAFPLHCIKSIPDIHTHPQPDAIQPSLFLHQVHSQQFIGLMTVVRQSPITYLPHSICSSLSFLALYISVPSPVCCTFSYTSLFTTLCSFPLSHPQFPISTYPCFIYLYSILLSTLL